MGVRILLVDDNQTFVAALRQFLDFLPGAAVVGQARCAGEALDAVVGLDPDLVLIDVEIPGMHGLELASRILARDPAPVTMLLSVHEVGAYAESARAIGVRALASKSDFVTELLPAIEDLVGMRAHGVDTR
jgi:DNA-binding NarL/FixJ family response regulator